MSCLLSLSPSLALSFTLSLSLSLSLSLALCLYLSLSLALSVSLPLSVSLCLRPSLCRQETARKDSVVGLKTPVMRGTSFRTLVESLWKSLKNSYSTPLTHIFVPFFDVLRFQAYFAWLKMSLRKLWQIPTFKTWAPFIEKGRVSNRLTLANGRQGFRRRMPEFATGVCGTCTSRSVEVDDERSPPGPLKICYVKKPEQRGAVD